MEMRRRGFLLGVAAGACGMIPSDDRSPAARADGAAIAPPGSDGGARLRARCTGCNLCVAKCPSKVLKAATLDYGLAGTMMPVMDFSRGYCERDCTLCGEVCPTGAIRRLTPEEKAQERIGRAALVPDWRARCLASTDGHPCALCERHCPYGAVKVDEETAADGKKSRRPRLDASKCVGCGACAHVCPAHALAIRA